MNWRERTIVCGVSGWLVLVLIGLLIVRRLSARGLARVFLYRFRPVYRRVIDVSVRHAGHCWIAPLPFRLCSDRESFSLLTLSEDGQPLGPAHVIHDEIAQRGKGRFSHWGQALFFSTSDNSDPNTNCRRYEVREIRP